jgi:hypothetical protein
MNLARRHVGIALGLPFILAGLVGLRRKRALDDT